MVIPLSDLSFEVSRSSGPGGQNVNKVNSRVTLRFDLVEGGQMSQASRERLLARLGSRLARGRELVIHADEHREQGRNRAAAIARLVALLADALRVQKPRRATRPTKGSVDRRIAAARRRGQLKSTRRKPTRDD